MKCVGLLIFVLLLQSVDKFFKVKYRKKNDYSAVLPTLAPHVPDVTENIEKDIGDRLQKASQKADIHDEFDLKLNDTDGAFIPGELLLTVPLSDFSVNLLTSFHSLQESLIDVSACASTLLSHVAKSLFTLLNKIESDIGSSSEERSSLIDVMPEIFSAIEEVIARLEIGTSISDAVLVIQAKLQQVIGAVDEVENSDSNNRKKLNDAVLSLAESVQVLIVAISVITDASTAKIGTISTEVKETVVSLTMILQATIVIVQSISYTIAASATPTSAMLNAFVIIIDRTLSSITNINTSITLTSVMSTMSLVVSTIGVTLTSIAFELNDSMQKFQASVVLEVSDKNESDLFKLIGSKGGYAASITTSIATITSSISSISAFNSGVQSKMSRQLYPVFQALLQITGSDDEIVTTLQTSLANIFEALKSSAKILAFGIGIEVTETFIKTIEDTLAILLEVVQSVQQSEMNVMDIDRITKECAKNCQIFNSIVVATSKTISEAINAVNTVALEAVIALQILHSAVLYVVEYVTAVASSVILTNSGEQHELLSSLAVILVIMLEHDSKTIELIAILANRSVSNVVSLISVSISKLKYVSATMSNISGVNTDTTVKIDQIASGGAISVEGHARPRDGGSAISVEGVPKTEGNLSQILDGLTGSLSTISSTFSSSLHRLNSSLKQISLSESEILRTVSNVLMSVITKLSAISGPANQILFLTSNSLNSFFGNLVESTSSLSALGDVSVSISSAVTQISVALHSLVRAINIGTVHILIDAIKNVAKCCQVLISTFFATFDAAANASNAIRSKVSVAIAALPYITSTVVLVVQQVIGSAIPVGGSVTIYQHELTLSMSKVLESLTYIAADTTKFVMDGYFEGIPSNILLSVSDLNNSTSLSLSRISGVVANFKVTLRLDNEAS